MIKKATPADLPMVANLIVDHFKKARDKTLWHTVFAELEKCITQQRSEIYIAVDEKEGCTGYIVVHWLPVPLIKGSQGYISDLLVTGHSRGRGQGTDLVSTVEDEARLRGCIRLVLNNFRKAQSYKRSFYAKQGFEERDDFANFTKSL